MGTGGGVSVDGEDIDVGTGRENGAGRVGVRRDFGDGGDQRRETRETARVREWEWGAWMVRWRKEREEERGGG